VARRPACCFRLVHRKIGVAQDFDGTALLVGSYCDDADASADTGTICSGAVTFVLNDYRFFKRCVQPVDDVLDIAGLYGRGQQRHELVAADASDDVVDAQSSAETLGGDLKDGVTGVMSERVVDALEFIHVDEKHSAQTVLIGGDRVGDERDDVGTVGQPGHQIVGGLVNESLMGVVLFGDVGE
jgi:hypothetical protein